MSWSFSLGRLLGSELRVHVTFFLLLAWVGYAGYVEAGWPGALRMILFISALFACVVAHEFGHALTARSFGIRTPDVTLLPIGGVARLERMPESPRQEILVALAGPAVNVAIFVILVGLFGAIPSTGLATGALPGTTDFFAELAVINLYLAIFNMIPAFPMDGGRVLRAVLAANMDRVKATRIAALAGQTVALGFGFLGLSAGNPVLVLIAVFVFVAATAESNEVAMRAVARRMVVRDAMITHFESLFPGDHIATASDALIRTTQGEFPVLDADRLPKGVLTRHAIFAAQSEGQQTQVRDIMTTEPPVLGQHQGLELALTALGTGAPAVLVTDPSGAVVGYITRENLGELMVVHSRDA